MMRGFCLAIALAAVSCKVLGTVGERVSCPDCAPGQRCDEMLGQCIPCADGGCDPQEGGARCDAAAPNCLRCESDTDCAAPDGQCEDGWCSCMVDRADCTYPDGCSKSSCNDMMEVGQHEQ